MSNFISRLALGIYSTAGYAILPFMRTFLRLRARKGKEDKFRIRERFGYPSKPRASRVCVWVHAASLGETRAVMPLVRRLTEMQFEVILTTVTVTAAHMAADDLPEGAHHQFVPFDLKPYVARFLDYWKPSLAVFVESEVWPTTIIQLRRRNIPHALVNARMSERSFKRWRQLGFVSHFLFENVSLCVAQTSEDASRFSELGVAGVMNGGNLKFDADIPNVDEAELLRLKASVGQRPVWLAASTHDREELIVAKAHLSLKQHFPNLLTVIVPRHPARTEDLTKAITKLDLTVTRRSLHALPDTRTDIFMVDTIGELGLFYSLVPCSLVGGSLVPHGGQNPIEPARLGSAIIHGPNVANFATIFEALADQGGCVCVRNSDELIRRVAELLSDSTRSDQMVKAAKKTLCTFGGAVEYTHNALLPYLNPLIVAERLADVESRHVAGE